MYAALLKEVARRGGPAGVKVTPTGCLTPCQCGPNVVVYPAGVWYGPVAPEDAAEMVAVHLDDNASVERLLLSAEAQLW